MTRRNVLLGSLAAFGLVRGDERKTGHTGAPKLTANAVLHELREGNRRFAGGHPKHPHGSLKWLRRVWREGQHPHAIVLCCSDSRVSPEILFDQGIGDLFVVRVAGNVANEDEIASIEYAVEHLATPLVVVMGHTECGAVSAVVERQPMPKEIEHLVVHINDAMAKVQKISPELSGRSLITATVEMNVRESMEDMLRDGEVLARYVRSGSLAVVGAVCHLDSGKVTWL